MLVHIKQHSLPPAPARLTQPIECMSLPPHLTLAAEPGASALAWLVQANEMKMPFMPCAP